MITGRLIFLVLVLTLNAYNVVLPQTDESSAEPITTTKKRSHTKKISLSYDNEDLVNVINYLASQKNVNVILPMRADDKITGRITWVLDKKVTIDEAFELLKTILDVAGYTMVPKPEYYEIVKNPKEISREPMPVYIGTKPEDLPASDQQIRYIYYLANIKLEETEGEKPSELGTALKTLLPTNSSFKINASTNSILIMAPSIDVRSVMEIIVQLDRPGFQEKMEIIPLHYANARNVADLFNNKILQSDANRYRLDAKKATESTYFSKYVRIIANERKNFLIVLGRPQAIDRIQSFIEQYVDIKPDTGESIIHIYQLQYLDAAEFAQVLRNIVESKKTEGGGPEQSAGEKKAITGPERFFEEVLIAIDRAKDEDVAPPPPPAINDDPAAQRLPPPKYYGSNNLVIACRSDDWKRIKDLIEALDKPQPQVLIEVLIADLSLDDTKALGNFLRNPAVIPMPSQFNIQSAQLDPGVLPNSIDNPATIGVIPGETAADLGKLFKVSADGVRSDATSADADATSVYQQATFAKGSTAISISDADGKTWSISQILSLIDNNRILSHPHVISIDNQEARIENTVIRLLAGDTKTGQGGATIRSQVPVSASLKVAIRPRISMPSASEQISKVNLQVRIDINEYKTATDVDNTRITRNVTTNVTMNSGEVLALGGLIRTNEADSVYETPILSQIPILGWFFKAKDQLKRRTNLTVFISPTVIEPRLRGGMGEYTRDYVNLAKNMARTDLFANLKDPITRWFFDESGQSLVDKSADKFMSKDELYRAQVSTPMPVNNNGEPTKKDHAKKEQADYIKNMMQNVDENPFQRANETSTIRLRS